MPAALLTRDETTDRLLTVFRRNGFDGTSLADLSKATGLGRSSLYHHFPGGKDEMATAVLDRVDAWLQVEVIGPLRADGAPANRLRRALTALDSFYAGGRERCILGSFVIGSSNGLFHDRLNATFSRLIDALAEVARDNGGSGKLARRRAEQAVIQMQGALVLAAALNDPRPFRSTLKELPAKLLTP